MKIAQLVSNLNKVFLTANNAIYSHVGNLCDAFVTDGDEVTLFGSGDSETKANIVSVYPIALNLDQSLTDKQKNHYINHLISECYKRSDEFDIIHSHFTLLSSFFSELTNTPTLISVHSPIDQQIKPFLEKFKNNYYLSFSWAQRRQMPELNWFANIYHGVDTNKFSFNPAPKDYFLYLGRVTEEKGVHLAIEAAQKANVKLMIAGKSYPGEGYWHKNIEKNIDGKNIIYIGEQSFEDKIKLLQDAKALLFPSQCEEVFGYSMIESMSCGTPVIGWNKGSVPEVIKNGETGYIVNSVEEMVEAINKIDKIDRNATRKRVEIFFSIEKMIKGYRNVYKKLTEIKAREKIQKINSTN